MRPGFGTAIKDYRVVYVGAGKPPVGGNIDTGKTTLHAVCRPQELNRGAIPGDDTEEKTQVVQAEDFNPLPITPDFYRCELGDFEAGSYNVSVQLPMGLAWSNPVDTGLYARDATGLKYQVQYYPIIKEMSPQLGSIAGGTEVTIRGHGFSMDEEDISIDIGGSKCVVESSTLEEIICVTEEQAAAPAAAPAPTPVTPSVTVTLEDDAAEAVGMVTEGSGGTTFVSDQGQRKGEGWAIFSGAVTQSGMYQVKVYAATCANGATSVPVVIYHSETARRTVETADLSSAGAKVFDNGGSGFWFDAPTDARVIVDNSGTSGCVAVDKVEIVPVGSAADGPAAGCTDTSAINYDAAADSDDGSCLFVGGRGLLRQQWALMPNETQYDIAASSPASVARTDLHVDRACPKPGEEEGWEWISGNTSTRMAGDPGDCMTGYCPSHDACPTNAFCCLDSAHARCHPAIGNASAFDSEDGWTLVFRQVLPSQNLIEGGYWEPGVLSKNSDNSSAGLYSILDQLETMHDENDMYELKLKYPGQPDVHWKQSVNPVSGDSLLTSNFEYVTDPTDTWHLMFRQAACTVTHDSGESWFNELFAKSKFLVRYDRMDEDSGEVVPFAYYRRTTPCPSNLSPYDLLLNAWHADGTSGNVQDEDWRAYSTEEDALADVNAWTTCDYSERTKRGFPGDCGPVGAELLKWISKEGCSPSASPDAALYIYAPAAAATAQPEKFRGLSSKIAAAHGHLLDGEGLDVITKDDHVGYIPWYGLGVSQHAPAAAWEHGVQDALDEAVGFTWHWWHHSGSIAALKAKDSYPDNPDGSGGAGQRAAGTDGGDLLLAEIGPNWGNNYGGRMFGYFRANQDGLHTFYISGDDDMEL